MSLRLTLDARYPQTVEEAASRCKQSSHTGACTGGQGAERGSSNRDGKGGWTLFPQHGIGKKHTRAIALAGWQRALANEFPEQFLRGLIHSDGCRVVNRFTVDLPSGRRRKYAYPRYFFSNLSPDIRRLFCEYCERVGVHWTQSNARNISVADRQSVAVLDGFIGEKR